MPDFNEEEYLDIVNKATSGLSIAFCIFSLLIYKFSGRQYLNSLKIEVIVWLIFSIFLETSSSAFIPVESKEELKHPSILCTIQSTFSTIFGYSHSIWNAIIAYVSFIHVIKPEHIDQNKCVYRIIFLSIAFGLPLIMASV